VDKSAGTLSHMRQDVAPGARELLRLTPSEFAAR